MSFQSPQFAILPAGAMYNTKPDIDIITVEITREKLVKLRRLKTLFLLAMVSIG
jgi:hypothetical protein